MHRFRVVSKSWNLPIENGLKLNLENKSCENRRIRSLKLGTTIIVLLK